MNVLGGGRVGVWSYGVLVGVFVCVCVLCGSMLAYVGVSLCFCKLM